MDKILFTFPGQGAQIPGMLHTLAEQIPCSKWYLKASEILEENVLELDTYDALQTTRAVQLCNLISGVVCADWLQTNGVKPNFTAGLSIGAFPAAVISGALDFEDAIRLVSLRGTLMQNAWPTGYGLSAISNIMAPTLSSLVDSINSSDMPVYMANFNAPDQFVIAGSDKAMDAVMQLAKKQYSAKAERLQVAVPSHCPLLDQPATIFFKTITTISIKRPQIAYLSGSTGRVLWQPEKIAEDLAYNMARPVKWFDAMTAAYERGVRLAIEMPPGSVLTGLCMKAMEHGEAVSIQRHGLATAQELALRLQQH